MQIIIFVLFISPIITLPMLAAQLMLLAEDLGDDYAEYRKNK